MRLLKRGRARITVSGREALCALRPLSGGLAARLYGEYVQDTLRLLLPFGFSLRPGDRLLVQDAPYVCLSVRAFPGHVQADVRRCSR